MKIASFNAALREADPDYRPDTIEVYGEEFRIADSLPLAVFLKFSYTVSDDEEDNSKEGMEDLANMVACIFHDEAEAKRFLTFASKKKIDADMIGEIIRSVVSHLAARPTERRSDSQAGSSTDTTNSSTKSVPSPGFAEVRTLTPEELQNLGVTATG